MEPMNATALHTADRCEVWVPTQNGETAFAATLEASGLPADKCEVYKINLGGAFGRRGAFHDYVPQAVLIAKQMPGTPVKLLMSKHPKHLAVLDAVAERAGWGTLAPRGVYRGLAQMISFNSYVAACAEISVTDGHKVKVHRITSAIDPGCAVNLAQIERQIAGSFVYGLSALFTQECTVKDGRIVQENFHTFDSMRIAQMPKVESIIMPSGGFWGGIGEPTICVAAPAVLNAFFNATGRRIRSFPLKNHGIQLV
jgi:isoquinoline 1-oxidoreductase beta subunit